MELNTLSWLLYLSSVMDKISITGIVCGFAALVCLLIILMVNSSAISKQEKVTIELLKTLVVMFSSVFLVSILSPTKDVVYMIIASEMGEEIYNHPDTKIIYESIKSTVLKHLEDARG